MKALMWCELTLPSSLPSLPDLVHGKGNIASVIFAAVR
jgi:hypothetical protein